MTAYHGTTTSGTQPRKNMTTMGKIDTSDLMMMIRWVMNISSRMMTSSNGNIFRVTGHLCGKFTGPRWISRTKPVTRSFDVFFDLRLNKRLSKQPWGWWFETPAWSLWRHRNGSPKLEWVSVTHTTPMIAPDKGVSQAKKPVLSDHYPSYRLPGDCICHADMCSNVMQHIAFHKPNCLFSSFYLDPCHTS